MNTHFMELVQSQGYIFQVASQQYLLLLPQIHHSTVGIALQSYIVGRHQSQADGRITGIIMVQAV